jgi:hypothetical protein
MIRYFKEMHGREENAYGVWVAKLLRIILN